MNLSISALALSLVVMAGPSVDGSAPRAGICGLPDGPAYYAFELFTTKNIPGTGLAKGIVEPPRPDAADPR